MNNQGSPDQPGKMTCILKPGVLDCNQPLLCSWVVVFLAKKLHEIIFAVYLTMKTFTSPLRVWTCLENAGLWTLISDVFWVMSIFNLFPKSLRLWTLLLDWKYRGDKNWTYNFRCILSLSKRWFWKLDFTLKYKFYSAFIADKQKLPVVELWEFLTNLREAINSRFLVIPTSQHSPH